MVHGGQDGGASIQWDFSSNANPLPLPSFLQDRLWQADRTRYPDPHYTTVCSVLGRGGGVESARIVPTAGSSEAIRRLTLAFALRGGKDVWVPHPGYADYRAAARALGLIVHDYSDAQVLLSSCRVASDGHKPMLCWLCEPCNPTGHSLPAAFWSDLSAYMQALPQWVVAIDRAYEPLRLIGDDVVPLELAQACWQLWSPNKALGLTGVRAGWIQSPRHDPLDLLASTLDLAPSWVLSAEGVSLLMAWHESGTQQWLASARDTLLKWTLEQQAELAELGWMHVPCVTPFGLSQPPFAEDELPAVLRYLREQGIKVRDATSFGLPGYLRLRTHTPQARQALSSALRAWSMTNTKTKRVA